MSRRDEILDNVFMAFLCVGAVIGAVIWGLTQLELLKVNQTLGQ